MELGKIVHRILKRLVAAKFKTSLGKTEYFFKYCSDFIKLIPNSIDAML